MYGFLLLSTPTALLWFCFSHKKYSAKNFLPVVIIGLFAGILMSEIKSLFILQSSYVSSNFPLYICDINCRKTLIPAIILYGIFLLIELLAKDSREYKIQAFLPLTLTYQAILMPYYVISGTERYSFFLLFCLPVITISMYYTASLLITKASGFFQKNIKSIAFCSLFITGAVASIILISIIQGLWFFGYSKAIYFLLTLACAAIAYCSYKFLSYKEQ